MFRAIGEGPEVNTERAPRRSMAGQAKSAPHFGVDLPLMLALATLIIGGLVILYSASYDYSFYFYKDASTIVLRQVLWLAIGLVVATVLALLDYHIWQRLAVLAGVGVVGMLVAVRVVSVLWDNNTVNYATRSLFGASVQPSEAAKLMTVVYLAVWLYAKRDRLNQITFGLLPLAGILGIVGSLILAQPDLSAAITVAALGGLMFFLAGGDWRQIAIFMIAGVVIGLTLTKAFAVGETRMTEYLAGLADPTAGSDHVRRGIEALVNGGFLGVGIGNSVTKLTGLPVAATDSIFAVAGEELGFVGAAGLAALYVVVLWRGIHIALRAPDELGSLLAAGLACWISMEAFINMAVMLNLIPFAGNPLPFISSGGSNLVMSMAAMGILINVSRRAEQDKNDRGRNWHAVVDLRRWNRRRRLPGARRVDSARR